jgi:hypothetical protein
VTTAATLELLAWVSARPRSYAETMAAWRSNCPRHSTWEDAVIDGLVEVVDYQDGASDSRVRLTSMGKMMLTNNQKP